MNEFKTPLERSKDRPFQEAVSRYGLSEEERRGLILAVASIYKNEKIPIPKTPSLVADELAKEILEQRKPQ